MAPTPDDLPVPAPAGRDVPPPDEGGSTERTHPPPFLNDYASVPRIPLEAETREGMPDRFRRSNSPRDRVWVHVLLFLTTVVTTTLVGAGYRAGYVSVLGAVDPRDALLPSILGGLWYGLPVMAILGAHELGHYFACVHYRVNASLPYFLPVPPGLFIAGTLGAFIRIRQPIARKRQLFDIGIAGPLAGFLVAVPMLFVGLALSTVVPMPKSGQLIEFADPPIMKLAEWLVLGTIKDGYTINAHPMVFAAWFGFLATALNLFPIGQLDGGHISYAVIGRHSARVTLAAVGVAVLLCFVSASWIVWTGLLVVMLRVYGLRHPPTVDEDAPIGTTRLVLAVVAAAMLILSFTPNPIAFVDLLWK